MRTLWIQPLASSGRQAALAEAEAVPSELDADPHTAPSRPHERRQKDGRTELVEAPGIELNQAIPPNLLMTHAFAEFDWDF